MASAKYSTTAASEALLPYGRGSDWGSAARRVQRPDRRDKFSKLAIGSLRGSRDSKGIDSFSPLKLMEEQHAAVAALRRCPPVLGIMMAPSRCVGFRRSTGRVAARRA